MRVLGSTVLVLEALVVLLAIPIAINVSDANATLALVMGIALAGLLILSVGVITKPIAVPLVWVLQVLVIAIRVRCPHHVFCGCGICPVVVLRGAQWAASGSGTGVARKLNVSLL